MSAIILDTAGINGPSSKRGIGRYAAELGAELESQVHNRGAKLLTLDSSLMREPALKQFLVETGVASGRITVLILSPFDAGSLSIAKWQSLKSQSIDLRIGGIGYDLIPLRYPLHYFGLNPIIFSRYLRVIAQMRQNFDFLATISKFSSTEFRRVLSKSTRVFEIGADSSTFRNFKYIQRKKIVLYVGGVDHRKNPWILPPLFWLTSLGHLGFKLVMVGPRPKSFDKVFSLFWIALKLNPNQLCLKSHISDSELSKIYAEAEMLIFPSKNEGFGLPILEAMRVGCPVIALRRGGSKELLYGYPLGATKNSLHDFRVEIDKLIKDHKVRSEAISMGKEISEKFSWEVVAETLLENLSIKIEH